MKIFKAFLRDEEGAVTVDWVVLTAGVVVLAIAVSSAVQPAIDTELAEIATGITN